MSIFDILSHKNCPVRWRIIADYLVNDDPDQLAKLDADTRAVFQYIHDNIPVYGAPSIDVWVHAKTVGVNFVAYIYSEDADKPLTYFYDLSDIVEWSDTVTNVPTEATTDATASTVYGSEFDVVTVASAGFIAGSHTKVAWQAHDNTSINKGPLQVIDLILRPAPPTTIAVTETATDEVEVTWDAMNGAQGYYVYYINGATGSENAATIISTGNFFSGVVDPLGTTIDALTPGARVRATVVAYNPSGSSAGGTPAEDVLTPAKPTNIAAVSTASGEIEVTWDEPIGGDTYVIYYIDDGTGAEDAAAIMLGANTPGVDPLGTTVSGLTSGTTCSVTVTALNSEAEEGPPGDPVYELVIPAVPTGLGAATGPGEGELDLSCDAMTGAHGYDWMYLQGDQTQGDIITGGVLVSSAPASSTSVTGLAFTPGIPAYNVVDVAGAATPASGDSGLVADTTYYFNAELNGSGVATEYSFLTGAGPTITWEALVSLLDAAVTADDAVFAIDGGDNIRCTSTLTGTTSEVILTASTSGIPAYSTGDVGGNKELATETGLVADSTYYFNLELDGAAPVEYRFTTGSGADDTKYAAVIGFMNASITGASTPLDAVWSLSGPPGDLVLTSNDTSATSATVLTNGDTGIPGYDFVDVGGAKTGASATGLAGTTQYFFGVAVDGAGSIEYDITTATDLTYDDVIALMNTEIVATGATFAIAGGNLRCTSAAVTAPSTVVLAAGVNGIPGYNDVGVGANKTGSTETGLAGTTQYFFKVNIDGGGEVEYDITTGAGADDTKYDAVITLMNAATPAGAVFSLEGGDLRCTSVSTVSGSAVVLTAGTGGVNLFATLTGYTAINAPVAFALMDLYAKLSDYVGLDGGVGFAPMGIGAHLSDWGGVIDSAMVATDLATDLGGVYSLPVARGPETDTLYSVIVRSSNASGDSLYSARVTGNVQEL